MDTGYLLAFVVYPYLVIAVFFGGHAYRYATDLYHWNSRSSELLHKDSLRYGITLFHWGIIFTFLGHFFGLLTPQALLDRFGISVEFHQMVAIYTGMVFGSMALIGLILLVARRFRIERIAAVSSVSDVSVLVFLLIVVALGTYNTYFERFDVETTVAPWIQSVVSLAPKPELMEPVPWSYKAHVLAALTLLAYSPFTRLVHIWSVPAPYLVRKFLVFRARNRSWGQRNENRDIEWYHGSEA